MRCSIYSPHLVLPRIWLKRTPSNDSKSKSYPGDQMRIEKLGASELPKKWLCPSHMGPRNVFFHLTSLHIILLERKKIVFLYSIKLFRNLSWRKHKHTRLMSGFISLFAEGASLHNPRGSWSWSAWVFTADRSRVQSLSLDSKPWDSSCRTQLPPLGSLRWKKKNLTNTSVI